MPENRMTTESPVARNAVVSPKGGEELAALVEVFTADQSDENFVAVLDYLHDIDVIIPMTDVDEDEGHGIADAEIGDIITEEGKRLTPEVLEDPSGDQAFPVYATEAEIQKDYDDTFTFVTVPFMQVVEVASNYNVLGIIIDPFSEQLLIEKEYFDDIKKRPWRL
jgi:hypothetical protein